VLLHDVLGTRRVHAGAATRTHRREGAAARDRQRLAADHGGALDEEVLAQAAAARTRWSAADAVRSAIRGDLDAAAAHLADARTTAPRAVRPWWQHAREVLSGRNDDA